MIRSRKRRIGLCAAIVALVVGFVTDSWWTSLFQSTNAPHPKAGERLIFSGTIAVGAGIVGGVLAALTTITWRRG